MRNHTCIRRARLAGLSALAIILLVLGGACGGSDDEAGSSSGKQANGAGANVVPADQPEAGGAGERPEGFPEDVPVPSGEVRTSSQIGDVGWRAMIVVDLDAEVDALKAEYTTLYEDAGFTVTQEGTVYNMMAENEKWRVDLVVRPPTITVQVMDWTG